MRRPAPSGPAQGRLSFLRRFARREDGSSTVEFVVWVPFILVFVASMVDSCSFMLRWMLLDRGLDIAVRELRVSTHSPITHGEFRNIVCRHARLEDCTNSLSVDFNVLASGSWSDGGGNADCVDRAIGIDPANDALNAGGAPNEIVTVRACALMKPLFPRIGIVGLLPRDSNDELHVITMSAYAQEP